MTAAFETGDDYTIGGGVVFGTEERTTHSGHTDGELNLEETAIERGSDDGPDFAKIELGAINGIGIGAAIFDEGKLGLRTQPDNVAFGQGELGMAILPGKDRGAGFQGRAFGG